MTDITYFVKSTPLKEISLDLFNTLLICYSHIEDVHEEV